MWFKSSNRYFCKIEHFAYGEINERSVSNPHPSWIEYDWIDGWMDGWVDGWMGGWVDKWMGMDGWVGCAGYIYGRFDKTSLLIISWNGIDFDIDRTIGWLHGNSDNSGRIPSTCSNSHGLITQLIIWDNHLGSLLMLQFIKNTYKNIDILCKLLGV